MSVPPEVMAIDVEKATSQDERLCKYLGMGIFSLALIVS
jgi:hypothetical protein